VKEAGRAFAAPTYLFVASVALVLIIGIWKQAHGTLLHVVTSPGTVPMGHSQQLLTAASIFVLLRAFANGGSSLTGLEAISNGVSLFKAPEGNNARRTTVIMSSILGTLVLGVSWLAAATHATPYSRGTPTVISQIADIVFGRSALGHALYLFVQFSTMLILYTGANTPFSGFPFLANFIAEDGFLPRQLTKRGHRLVFSNGIILLTIASSSLLLAVGANVAKLIAFYAIGVFTGFAMAGFGMAKRAITLKDAKWRLRFSINFLSGAISTLIVIIFAVVKFSEGAWLIVLIFPLATAGLIRLNRQYRHEQIALAIDEEQSRATMIARHDVAVLIDSVDLATVGAIRYARSLNPHSLVAVHFVIDDRHAQSISLDWAKNRALSDVPLELIDCPDRRLPNAAVDFAIRAIESTDVDLTLLFPRRSYSFLLGRILHDRTAEAIAAPISQLERVVATIVPFDVEKIIAGKPLTHSPLMPSATVIKAPYVPNPLPPDDIAISLPGPVSHYAANLLPIGDATWRQRAHVRGRVTSIFTAPSGSAPGLDIEIWDQTGGITLHFLGRRGIAGLKAGTTICAEGMVGEANGHLTIMNPSYEIVM
jgi:hypothetical protein